MTGISVRSEIIELMNFDNDEFRGEDEVRGEESKNIICTRHDHGRDSVRARTRSHVGL